MRMRFGSNFDNMIHLEIAEDGEILDMHLPQNISITEIINLKNFSKISNKKFFFKNLIISSKLLNFYNESIEHIQKYPQNDYNISKDGKFYFEKIEENFLLKTNFFIKKKQKEKNLNLTKIRSKFCQKIQNIYPKLKLEIQNSVKSSKMGLKDHSFDFKTTIQLLKVKIKNLKNLVKN